jgi:hypothetical protein
MLARRYGQRDWRQGAAAREAIRQAALLRRGSSGRGLLEAGCASDERARVVTEQFPSARLRVVMCSNKEGAR